MYAWDSGISIRNSYTTDIVNTEVSHSGWFGLDINSVVGLTVTNTTVTEPFSSGIIVLFSMNVVFSMHL